MSSLFGRPRTADGPRSKRPDGLTAAGHKVSFSDSTSSERYEKSNGKRNSGKAPSTGRSSASPRPKSPAQPPVIRQQWAENQNLQRINRQSEALWQQNLISPTAPSPRPFLIYHDSFLSLLGSAPTLQLLIEDPRAPYFHEAGVFHPPTNTLFVTSNQLNDPSPDAVSTHNKTIVITKIEFFSPTDFTRDKVRCPERNYMANGGTNYRDGVIFCAQGSLREPSGLIYMEAKRPHKTTTLLNNYHSRPFNSPNDVVVHSDGSIWFTDPIYGYEQGFRPKPQLPQLVYRFDPSTGDIRAVADGLGRPNGLCFSPDESTLYITDTDLIHGDGGKDPRRAATIYAYSVFWETVSMPSSAPGGGAASAATNSHSHFYSSSSSFSRGVPPAAPSEQRNQHPYLSNRRVFAYVDTGAPDGIKCDVFGNVYAGCGDGVNVWNAGGMLIGKIQIEGGVSNFCFGRQGEMWLFGEHRLWRAKLGEETRGALLGI